MSTVELCAMSSIVRNRLQNRPSSEWNKKWRINPETSLTERNNNRNDERNGEKWRKGGEGWWKTKKWTRTKIWEIKRKKYELWTWSKNAQAIFICAFRFEIYTLYDMWIYSTMRILEFRSELLCGHAIFSFCDSLSFLIPSLSLFLVLLLCLSPFFLPLLSSLHLFLPLSVFFILLLAAHSDHYIRRINQSRFIRNIIRRIVRREQKEWLNRRENCC